LAAVQIRLDPAHISMRFSLSSDFPTSPESRDGDMTDRDGLTKEH